MKFRYFCLFSTSIFHYLHTRALAPNERIFKLWSDTTYYCTASPRTEGRRRRVSTFHESLRFKPRHCSALHATCILLCLFIFPIPMSTVGYYSPPRELAWLPSTVRYRCSNHVPLPKSTNRPAVIIFLPSLFRLSCDPQSPIIKADRKA